MYFQHLHDVVHRCWLRARPASSSSDVGPQPHVSLFSSSSSSCNNIYVFASHSRPRVAIPDPNSPCIFCCSLCAVGHHRSVTLTLEFCVIGQTIASRTAFWEYFLGDGPVLLGMLDENKTATIGAEIKSHSIFKLKIQVNGPLLSSRKSNSHFSFSRLSP